ncbi:MAG: serine protease inhibitor [Cyanobacteriota bacterium]
MPQAPRRRRRSRAHRRVGCHQPVGNRRRRSSPALTLALVLATTLVAVAVMAAPEQPQALEAICLRHHGAEACRVW